MWPMLCPDLGNANLSVMKLRLNSPTLVQRDFARIIQELGTPAQQPKPRGHSPGRHPSVRGCMATEKVILENGEDLEGGAAAGATGTPAFFINGEFISGAVPFETFQQVIEANLN